MVPDVILRHFNPTRLSLLLDESELDVLCTMSISTNGPTVALLGDAFAHLEQRQMPVSSVFLPAGLQIKGLRVSMDTRNDPPTLWGAPLVFVKGLRRIVVTGGPLLVDFEPNPDLYYVVVELE